MSEKNPKTPVAIRYDQAHITQTTQFMLTADTEQLILDCSSGPIPSLDGLEQIMPIHYRHAMPWSAVRRLANSLREVLAKHDQQVARSSPHFKRSAGLPRIESSHVE